MSHRNPSRPMSPHLTIWKWGPHMAASILNRATGIGLATAGAVALIWWLVAAATGPEAYETFVAVARGPIGGLIGVGLTWAMWQHTATGLRHLVMDIGAGFELNTNKRWALIVMIVPIVLTALTWAFILEAF